MVADPTSTSATDVHFESKDGTALFASLYKIPDAKATALVLHGYADHGGRYEEVAQTLCRQGFTVLCPDLRGHGRSAGNRGYIRSIEDYLEDVEAALAALVKEAGERPLLLVAHSNGALIALRLLADPFRCPKQIKAAILSSPFLELQKKPPTAKVLFAKVASRLLPKLALPNEIKGSDVTHDEGKIREHDKDTLCHDVASARWFTETLKTQAWVAQFAHRVTVPTCWLVSGMDVLASPMQSRKVQATIGGESSYHEFAEMRHEVFNEIDRKSVFAIVDAFCEQWFHK